MLTSKGTLTRNYDNNDINRVHDFTWTIEPHNCFDFLAVMTILIYRYCSDL